MIITIAAITYTILMGIVIVFQGCLALGLPWGAASMGGKFPGKYPPKMRVVAVIYMLILASLSLIVLIKAELILHQLFTFSKYAIWFVVIFSIIGTILKSITKSKIERIWIPVGAIQLIASLIVAIV